MRKYRITDTLILYRDGVKKLKLLAFENIPGNNEDSKIDKLYINDAGESINVVYIYNRFIEDYFINTVWAYKNYKIIYKNERSKKTVTVFNSQLKKLYSIPLIYNWELLTVSKDKIIISLKKDENGTKVAYYSINNGELFKREIIPPTVNRWWYDGKEIEVIEENDGLITKLSYNKNIVDCPKGLIYQEADKTFRFDIVKNNWIEYKNS